MKREKLNILILYNNWEAKVRNTILEHLKSFENYSDHHIYYLNVAYGVPFWVKYISSDLVIFHYTIMSLKWSVPEKSLFSPSITRLQKIIGYKVCLPQDEYVYNDLVCKFIHEQGIKSIFTCFDPEDYSKAYPENLTGVRHIETVFPGYLDEESLNKWSKGLKKHENREFDLGYRARRNPFWLGFAGVLKWKITDVFKKKAEGLNTNLSNDDKDVLYGENWYKFLGNCRCVLGVESGSSLLDFDGSIRKKVELFQKNFPESDFESCEQACFEGKDGNIELATISPRHFESIITKTCQVLIEGKYSGVLAPNIHYIPVKRDFSNVDWVISKIQNQEYCERMALKAYTDIVVNGNFTYRDFVNQVLDSVENKIDKSISYSSLPLTLLKLKHAFPFIFSPINYIIIKIKGTIKLYLIRYNLLRYFVS